MKAPLVEVYWVQGCQLSGGILGIGLSAQWGYIGYRAVSSVSGGILGIGLSAQLVGVYWV